MVTDGRRQVALIWAVHRTQDWWKHVGENLGFAHNVVVTERRGIGDRSITDDFYAAYRAFSDASLVSVLDGPTISDVVARCRVLRSLPVRKATRMVKAMTVAVERLLDEERPDVFLCFPIDNYVSDLIARRARARGVPTFEVTASALPDMTMLMHRGRLIESEETPDTVSVEARTHQLTDPLFTPAYVARRRRYTAVRFARTLGYFKLRGAAFRAWSHIVRDPLRFHLLDAGSNLGYKARWRDMRVLRLIDADWEGRLAGIPRDRRVLFGLQLIPEAAIDYWVEDLKLVRHEDMLIAAARRLTEAGYAIVVKDHPLQFGHRQVHLLETLKALGAVIVPYDVSGNIMLGVCGLSLTATGTLGLQAALLGNVSVTCEAYYTTPGDFAVLGDAADLDTLADVVANRTILTDGEGELADRRHRIIERLLRGSFVADFDSWRGFGGARTRTAATLFGQRLGERIRRLGPDGEDWHGRSMPRGGGRYPGSPLD